MATTEFCKSMQPRVFRSPRVEFAVMADVLSRYEPVVAADYHTEISLQSCSEPLSYVQLTPAKIFHIWHDDQNYAPFEQVLKVAGLEYVINLELREESRHDAHLELADNRFRDPFESLVSAIGAREQTGTAS
ncbi:MAG: hypothetical protein HY000_11020 [Planctomycetes bacterium]|nr:hypothetical protein [Planctomycetota bacterium]